MDVEDEPILPHEDQTDEIENEEVDEIDVDEDERDFDEESEETAGAADGERTQAEGRQESQVRQPSRAERRVQQALSEAKAAKAEVERLRAEMARPPAQPAETAAQRNERLAMMDPDQRVEYLLAEQKRDLEGRFGQLQFQMADSADRTAFDGLCARTPAAAKLKTAVEDYLAEMRRNGTTAPRETVLRYVIGDRALANATRNTTKATRTADVNRARQAARPASARSDAGATGRTASGEQEARRKRLEDMQI